MEVLNKNGMLDTHSLVPFIAKYNPETSVFWINSQLQTNTCPVQFKEKFSYSVTEFDKNQKEVTLMAERYGGQGIGLHGGGVRCGNLEEFQIKGIGKNLLAGENSDKWHSYGGLNLIDATYEAVNSILLNALFPLGAAKCYGILITGSNTAYLPGEVTERKGYGALLVREACIRPAHYIRAPFFSRSSEQKKQMIKDSSRVKIINQQLAKQFNETNDYLSYFGNMLANFANQFGFARVARIAHGSISPSNLSIDGRWLDLTNVSFLGGGINSAGNPSFYDEPVVILKVIEELLYTYAKYNGIPLNPQPLFDYYMEQFQARVNYHMSYVLGLDFRYIPGGLQNTQYTQIADIVHQVICSAKEVSLTRCEEISDNDPIFCLIKGLLMSLSRQNELSRYYLNSALPDSPESVDLLIQIYPQLIAQTYHARRNDIVSLQSYVKYNAIIALKRLLIAEFFFMGRLENYIYRSALAEDILSIRKVLLETSEIVQWAFDKELMENNTQSRELGSGYQRLITIYRSSETEVNFDVVDSVYSLTFQKKKQKLASFRDLMKFVNELPDSEFIRSEYNFKNYLQRFEQILSTYESH